MPYPLNTWWFWVFVAPEAVLFVGWLVFVVFAGIGFGATAAWERLTRGRRGGAEQPARGGALAGWAAAILWPRVGAGVVPVDEVGNTSVRRCAVLRVV